MNQKKFLRSLVLLLSINFLQLDVLAQGARLASRARADRINVSPPEPQAALGGNDNVKEIKESFAEALQVIRKNYIDGKKLNYNDTSKSSIDAMLRTLDPYSSYMDAKEAAAFKGDTTGRNFAIGVTIGDRKIGDETGTFVLASSQNSPAANADLRFGDKIVQVGNWDAKGHSAEDLRVMLRGPRGSKVKLTLERAADGQRQTVELKRDFVSQSYVPDAYMIRPGVGYIQMTRGFDISTAEELGETLAGFRNDGMTSLVLDLRDNAGGLLMQAVRVVNDFLPRGQLILRQKGRMKGSNTEFTAIDDNPDKSPLVILVSRKTASGAELVAGALQDHDRALIVGENTFGQGVVQYPFLLEGDSYLLLTVARFYTPSGRTTQSDFSSRFYRYSSRGVEWIDEDVAITERPAGSEHKTDLGRSVYSGGVAPDEEVKPRTTSKLQDRMIDPVFGFARELVNARVVGFESYAVRRPIDFTHAIKADEFAVTDDLFKNFKEFVARTPGYRLTEQQLEANREFIARQLRYDISTAAYGSVIAARVLRADDPQVLKAIEVMPKAAAMAADARK